MKKKIPYNFLFSRSKSTFSSLPSLSLSFPSSEANQTVAEKRRRSCKTLEKRLCVKLRLPPFSILLLLFPPYHGPSLVKPITFAQKRNLKMRLTALLLRRYSGQNSEYPSFRKRKGKISPIFSLSWQFISPPPPTTLHCAQHGSWASPNGQTLPFVHTYL